MEATMRALVTVALAGFSAAAFSEPIYLSCVYDSGPRFAHGSPLTFVFDEGRKEVLLGNGSPAKNVVISPTEISFLHEESIPISIDRIGGRFKTTVSTMAGEAPASGSCILTKKRKF
jgi:hypothetical protein